MSKLFFSFLNVHNGGAGWEEIDTVICKQAEAGQAAHLQLGYIGAGGHLGSTFI